MIEVRNIETWGWEHTIRGMRNPMNSWHLSDSGYNCVDYPDKLCDPHCTTADYCNKSNQQFIVGKEDLKLMRNLYNASLDNNFAHRKFMRQLMISFDIVAPLYFYKEFDTYKVGTVANSCSTMHKIHAKEFTLDDFSHEHLLPYSIEVLNCNIDVLNRWREVYLNGGVLEIPNDVTRRKIAVYQPKDKNIWWQLIQLLPSSYNQLRTVTMNYEVAVTIIKQRSNHRLDEWNQFVEVLKGLPMLEAITAPLVDDAIESEVENDRDN